MAAFQSGFQLGTAAFGQGQRMALAQEELAMSKERDARAKELHGLNVAALNRTAGREAEQDRITGQIRDYTTGLQRPETNAALDADFNAADQASMQGLKLPAVRGGSNMANQEALAVRKPVDVNSPEYRSGLAGLRQQFALTKGDMADFDRVGEAERKRFTDKDDADYVLDLQKNPTGESASQARSFINAQSKKLSSKVDPKTGMTTFALVKGDGYDEIKVSPADLSKVAVGFRRLQRGDVGGLDVIAGVNKDLAAVAREELKIDVELGKTNNDASYKSGVLDNQGKELDIKRGQAAATAQYYRDRINAERTGRVSGKVEPEFTKVPEDGTRVRDSAGNVFTYAEGVPLVPGGIAPSARTDAFKKAGMPALAEKMVEWLPGGRYVRVPDYDDDVYDINNPADQKLIKKAIESASNANVATRELGLRGFAPRRPESAGEAVYRARGSEMGRNRDEMMRKLEEAHNRARSQ
jgi:hypothetical protein